MSKRGRSNASAYEGIWRERCFADLTVFVRALLALLLGVISDPLSRSGHILGVHSPVLRDTSAAVKGTTINFSNFVGCSGNLIRSCEYEATKEEKQTPQTLCDRGIKISCPSRRPHTLSSLRPLITFDSCLGTAILAKIPPIDGCHPRYLFRCYIMSCLHTFLKEIPRA